MRAPTPVDKARLVRRKKTISPDKKIILFCDSCQKASIKFILFKHFFDWTKFQRCVYISVRLAAQASRRSANPERCPPLTTLTILAQSLHQDKGAQFSSKCNP